MQAITYYGWKRFFTGRGVSQPSQQRYVQYFEMAYKREVQSPSMKRLKLIKIYTIPKSTGNLVQPVIEIMDGKNFEMIWTNNPKTKVKNKKNSVYELPQTYKANEQNIMEIFINDQETGESGQEVCGDLYFRLINLKNKELICRFAMNTSFICEKPGNIYSFDKRGVDPDSILNNKKYDNDFRIDLHFSDSCEKCKPSNSLDLLCVTCKNRMPDEYKEWKTIQTILDKHLEQMRFMQNEILKASTKMQTPRSRSNSVRQSRKNFRDVGNVTNFFNQGKIDYDKIISERSTNIVCEILSDRNRAMWRDKMMASHNLAQNDFLKKGLQTQSY